jgi:hypothetical protein
MTDTIEKINIDNIETQIYSGSRTNLLIMISTTRNKRVGLIPHLWINSESLDVHIMSKLVSNPE